MSYSVSSRKYLVLYYIKFSNYFLLVKDSKVLLFLLTLSILLELYLLLSLSIIIIIIFSFVIMVNVTFFEVLMETLKNKW